MTAVAGGVGVTGPSGYVRRPVGPEPWPKPTPAQTAQLAAVFGTEPNLWNRSWRLAVRRSDGKSPAEAVLQQEIDKLMPLRQTWGKGSQGLGSSEKVLRSTILLCEKCGARLLQRKAKLLHPNVGCNQDRGDRPLQAEFTGPTAPWTEGYEQRRLLP